MLIHVDAVQGAPYLELDVGSLDIDLLSLVLSDVADLVGPFPAERVAYFPVSTKVNTVQHDDPTLSPLNPSTCP